MEPCKKVLAVIDKRKKNKDRHQAIIIDYGYNMTKAVFLLLPGIFLSS